MLARGAPTIANSAATNSPLASNKREDDGEGEEDVVHADSSSSAVGCRMRRASADHHALGADVFDFELVRRR